MTIYRGPGGTGTATSDADTTEFQEFLVQSQAARDAAQAAQTAAELAETHAETAETNAASSASAASTSASAASTSASSASSSATAAATSDSNASTSASSAASSAASASTSASTATTKAAEASTSATNAAASASAAVSSATSAAGSATTATNSMNTAGTLAGQAATSAGQASTSAGQASSSATSAAASATSASTSATNAASSATAAASSATAAAASAASINDATLVHKTGDETIAGTKTFSSPIAGSVTGNAATATTATNVSGGTASVTTLTTSSTVTLNGGTANGVPYLNGSKVLTSGSALTFDGTNFGVNFTANSRGGVVMTTSNNSGTSEQGGYAVTNGNGTGLFSGVNGASYSTGGIGNANNAVLYSIGNTDLVFGRNTSEQMRLTSTGLGIGTSTPSEKLDVRGNVSSGNGTIKTVLSYATTGIVGTFSNHGLSFYTNTAEVGRFDTSGNLLVGTTTAWVSLGASVQVANGGAKGQYAAGPGNPSQTYTFGRDNVTTGSFVFAYNGSVIASISPSTGVYTPLSDSRAKKNITTLPYGLNEILKIEPVVYNMVTEKDFEKKHIGLIAQNVKSIMDEAVDDLIDKETQMYGLDKSVLVPVLIKAIQEQQAIITALTARVSALEASNTPVCVALAPEVAETVVLTVEVKP